MEYSVRGRSSGERGEVIRVWAKLSKGAIGKFEEKEPFISDFRGLRTPKFSPPPWGVRAPRLIQLWEQSPPALTLWEENLTPSLFYRKKYAGNHLKCAKLPTPEKICDIKGEGRLRVPSLPNASMSSERCNFDLFVLQRPRPRSPDLTDITLQSF